MAALKKYKVFESGGKEIDTIYAENIDAAAFRFQQTLSKSSVFTKSNSQIGDIRLAGNCRINSDFAIFRA